MTPTKSKLHTHHLAQDRSHINLPNGNTTSITAIGNIRLEHDLVLSDTLVVPEFKFNLLSVSKLTRDNNCMAVFNPQMCLIQDYATKTLKAAGKEAGGLYHLIEEPVTKLDTEATAICNTVLNNALNNCVAMPESVVLAANSQQNNDFHLWHQRLGHASMSRLKYIDCISVKPAGLQRCLTCPMAKFSKLPYSLSDSHCAHIFHMIHIDIWGPYRVPT